MRCAPPARCVARLRRDARHTSGATRGTPRRRRKRDTRATQSASRRRRRAICARVRTDSVDTQYARADSVTPRESSCAIRRARSLAPRSARQSRIAVHRRPTTHREGDRRSREGRSMDRRLLGRTAASAIHPAPPDDAASLLRPGGRGTGYVARRGYAASAPDCVAHGRTIATHPTTRATGSARLTPAATQLLCPMEPPRSSASRPTHRNARRHQTS